MHWYLGFQQAYTEVMVDKFQLTNVKPVSTPMEMGLQLSQDQGPLTPGQVAMMCGVLYAEGIGSVLWPVLITCLCVCGDEHPHQILTYTLLFSIFAFPLLPLHC